MEVVTDSAILAVKAIFSAYSGYSKGSFVDTDRAIREEVRRRGVMLSNHLDNIHDTAHESRHRNARRESEKVNEICQQIQNDAQYGSSQTPHTGHEGIGKMNKKSIKKLVKHDLSTLEKLVKCTKKVNEIFDSQSKNPEEAEVVQGLRELTQMCTGARNHFLERNMIIDGLTKR
jgi:hypothetical protein